MKFKSRIKIPRSKIHPKVVFQTVSEGDYILLIGTNNSDIKEVLKHKKVKINEVITKRSNEIIEKIEKYGKNQFDYVIANLEISKLSKISQLVPLLTEKAEIAFFRVRNGSLFRKKQKSSKYELLKIFRNNNLKILRRLYCRKNSIYNSFWKNLFANLFSYYVIYLVSKKTRSFAFQEEFAGFFLRKIKALTKTQTALVSERK